MHTKDILAAELRKIGLIGMADKAAEGYYHDFLSPLATPCLQLEFDATKEEAEEWADSPEGRAAFAEWRGQ